jgi:hypothetical protein
VGPLFAVEIAARAATRLVLRVFPLEALVARPCFDQRPVHRKVFVAHQTLRLRSQAAEPPFADSTGRIVGDSYKGMSGWGRQVAGSRLRRAEPGARDGSSTQRKKGRAELRSGSA